MTYGINEICDDDVSSALTNGSNIEINEAGRYQIIFEVFFTHFYPFAPFLILFTCYLLFTAVKYN